MTQLLCNKDKNKRIQVEWTTFVKILGCLKEINIGCVFEKLGVTLMLCYLAYTCIDANDNQDYFA